jgi:hypothetical protein
MTNSPAAPISPHVLERYQRDFYTNTDLVFRFGLVLTVSREGAERITEAVFARLVEGFDRLPKNTDPLKHLLSLTWNSWMDLRGERFHEWNSPVVASLKALKPDERACLFLVDMAGLNAEQSAVLMTMSEKDVRIALAAARRRLAKGEIKF